MQNGAENSCVCVGVCVQFACTFVCVCVCVESVFVRNFACFGTRLAIKQNHYAAVVSLMCADCSPLFLCVCISLPTHACTSLSCSLFSLLQYGALPIPSSSSSTSSTSPLFVTWVQLLPWSASPGFCTLLFLSLPTLSSFTNKGQVGIRADTHLNKE